MVVEADRQEPLRRLGDPLGRGERRSAGQRVAGPRPPAAGVQVIADSKPASSVAVPITHHAPSCQTLSKPWVPDRRVLASPGAPSSIRNVRASGRPPDRSAAGARPGDQEAVRTARQPVDLHGPHPAEQPQRRAPPRPATRRRAGARSSCATSRARRPPSPRARRSGHGCSPTEPSDRASGVVVACPGPAAPLCQRVGVRARPDGGTRLRPTRSRWRRRRTSARRSTTRPGRRRGRRRGWERRLVPRQRRRRMVAPAPAAREHDDTSARQGGHRTSARASPGLRVGRVGEDGPRAGDRVVRRLRGRTARDDRPDRRTGPLGPGRARLVPARRGRPCGGAAERDRPAAAGDPGRAVDGRGVRAADADDCVVDLGAADQGTLARPSDRGRRGAVRSDAPRSP